MLNSSINEREDQYQKLIDFTKEIDQEIIKITSALNWTMESIKLDDDNKLVCPYDSSHQISKKNLHQHLEHCQWKQEGYNEFDIPLPESSLSLNSYSSIKLDSQTQNKILWEAKEKDPTMKIANYECSTWHKRYFLSKYEFLTLIIGVGERLIPRTSNRIFTDFTCDERKILYDYVVANTIKPDIGHDITDIQKQNSEDKEDKEDKKLSFLEVLIQERNLKRRRAKHRGVHTNKKSHTEILREVIHQQMQLYIEYITDTHTNNHTTETVTSTEIQNSDINNHVNIQNSDLLIDEFSEKYHDVFTKDLKDHYGNSNSRNDKNDRYFEKSHISHTKNSKETETYSRTNELYKAQKSYKRKRSHSREHDYDKKNKYVSSRTHYKKNNMKSHKSEKSFDIDGHSKRNIDRRGNREKLNYNY